MDQNETRAQITQELRTKLRESVRQELLEAMQMTVVYMDGEVERYLMSPAGQGQIDQLTTNAMSFVGSMDMPSVAKH